MKHQNCFNLLFFCWWSRAVVTNSNSNGFLQAAYCFRKLQVTLSVLCCILYTLLNTSHLHFNMVQAALESSEGSSLWAGSLEHFFHMLLIDFIPFFSKKKTNLYSLTTYLFRNNFWSYMCLLIPYISWISDFYQRCLMQGIFHNNFSSRCIETLWKVFIFLWLKLFILSVMIIYIPCIFWLRILLRGREMIWGKFRQCKNKIYQ